VLSAAVLGVFPSQEKGGVDLLTLWSIFWRTFASLATATLVAAQGYDWASGDYRAKVAQLGFGLLLAVIGAAVAAGWAFVQTPAVTAIDKAVRSLVQYLLGAVGAVVINSFADFVALPKLLVPAIIGAVIAFALTYFSNQGTVPPATTSP
jgi:uncharacterized membrane protein YeaQ/YmgE (transglycosylase-associated protein family)